MSVDADPQVAQVHSRDNPLVKLLRRLAKHNTAYRKQGQIWVEGDHLCRAALQRAIVPAMAVFAESSWAASGAIWAPDVARVVVVPDAVFDEFSSLESPARMGFVLSLIHI